MRIRSIAVAATLATALGLLTAAPAAAAYDVDITFPGGNTEFYSPFGGPAYIKFTFINDVDSPRLFRVRLRPVGGSTIATDYFSINPDSQNTPVRKRFYWSALSTGSDKPYEVLVNPDGQSTIAQASFILHPRLASITSIRPSPFFPWINDDYKDETTVMFELAATSYPTYVNIYKAKASGKCCGGRVRHLNIGTKVPGADLETWSWNGRDDYGKLLPKGDYYVKITATDPADVTRTSKPVKVSIARTYRVLATLQKNGIAYHHTGPVSVYRRGGNCFVTKDETDKDLWITCLSASFKVYWRWALPNGGRIEKAAFTMIKVSSSICNAKKGHTTTDSYLQVGGVGQFRCRVDKAKITYSVPKSS